LARILPIERVFIWNRSGAHALASFVEEKMGLKVECVIDLASATKESDVIITCTPAKKWYLGREHVKPGTFIAAIGSDSPDKQEIEPELIATTSIVPDLLKQASSVGDLHHALKEGLMNPNEIRGELGQIVSKIAPSRISDEEIIIFDSTGTALQDTAAAVAIYLKAKKSGDAKSFNFL
jgi:ornithine cyclodeaminase/alanine dehydrogenase